MSKLPQVAGHRVVKVLQKVGYEFHHQKGSHITLVKTSERSKRIVVPIHKSKSLGKGLLHTILKDAGLTVDQFKELL